MPIQKEFEEFKQQIKMAQEVMVESLKTVAENGEIFGYAAKCYRQLYLKLRDEGFTDEQALSIVQRYNPLSK
jgi:hypothetical protein